MDEIFASRPFSIFGAPKTPRSVAPGVAKPWRPGSFNPVVIGLFTIAIFTTAIGVEVTLSLSDRFQGFPVNSRVAYNFGSIQFIKSFLPTALIAPFVLIWATQDQWLRLLQPYVELSNGNCPASRSLLLDYVSISKFRALVEGYNRGQWIIFLSALVTVMNLALQPLAGSVLIIRNLPRTNIEWTTITSTRSLGLDPTFSDLTAFSAAAGYAEAAVFHNLTDPPFVKNNFTVAEFQFPTKATNNGTLLVNTTGIQTSLNCFNPDPGSVSTTPNGTTLLTVTAMWNGCPVITSINISQGLSEINQYGVKSASPCGPSNSTVPNYVLNPNSFFQPIMFWFWNPNANGNGTAVTRVVLCAPTLNVYTVQASSNMTTNLLKDVKIVAPVGSNNNVTGPAPGLNGAAFNGVLFNLSQSADPFVQDRAAATTIGIPGAIFRYATQAFGVTGAFTNQDVFFNSTVKVYTQHLSIIAKSIYFLQDQVQTPAQIIENETRLWVDANAAHALSVLLFITGLLTLFIYAAHRQACRNLNLLQQPGSLAFAAGIASNWSTTLSATDSKEATAAKLSGLRFGLDDAGHIIVQDSEKEGGLPILEQQPGRKRPTLNGKHSSAGDYSDIPTSSPSGTGSLGDQESSFNPYAPSMPVPITQAPRSP